MMNTILSVILPVRVYGYLKQLHQYSRAVRRAAAVSQRNKINIESLLQSTKPINLELGAGRNRGIPGWTYVDSNTDCDLELELSQPLPFPPDRVDRIYSSHLLEHFEYRDLINLLSECLRILKPDGIFSAAVPNARIFLDAYHDGTRFDHETYCTHKPAFHFNSKIDYVNYIAYMDGHHRYMFDEDNLIQIMKSAGFRNVMLRPFDPNLDEASRNYQSIYVEAIK